jgi:hypothetical protein
MAPSTRCTSASGAPWPHLFEHPGSGTELGQARREVGHYDRLEEERRSPEFVLAVPPQDPGERQRRRDHVLDRRRVHPVILAGPAASAQTTSQCATGASRRTRAHRHIVRTGSTTDADVALGPPPQTTTEAAAIWVHRHLRPTAASDAQHLVCLPASDRSRHPAAVDGHQSARRSSSAMRSRSARVLARLM